MYIGLFMLCVAYTWWWSGLTDVEHQWKAKWQVKKNLLILIHTEIETVVFGRCRSWWPCLLWRRPLDYWVRWFASRWRHEYSTLGIIVCCLGSGLCDGLITFSEESYRVYESNCAWFWHLNNEATEARLGVIAQQKINSVDALFS
jgi:hypothetical protein